jgi:hypothetical protein
MNVCPECGQALPGGGFCAQDGAPFAAGGDDPLLGAMLGPCRVAHLVGLGSISTGPEAMTRRGFLARFMSALVGAHVLGGLSACGGEDGGGRTDAGGGSFVVLNDDDSGHTHELTVLCADLAAGVAVSYIASGPHSHTVMLTQDQIVTIAAGGPVTIAFTDGHSHTFVISEPAGVC